MSPDAPSPPSWFRGPGPWIAGAILAALVLYLPTLTFGWIYDDQTEVVNNTLIRSFSNLPRIFTSTVWAGAGMETFLYRPLAIVSYAVNHAISGVEPWSYHLGNVTLHAATSALVVCLGLSWGLPVAAAGVGGLLFAVHPIHVEAVAPVFGRKDLLASFFTLALILAHRGALERGGWRRGAAPLLYLAAMLSKEVGVVGIALVAAQDFALEKDRRGFLRRRDVPVLYASYLGVAALFLVLRTSVTGGLGIPDTAFWDNPLVAAGLAGRVATALVVVGKGVALQLLPWGQSPDYSFDVIPLVTSMRDPRLVATLFGFLAIAGLAAATPLRHSVLPLGLAWYALALLPASNLVVVSGTIFAERLLYLPSVAFCLLAGAATAWLVRRPGWRRAQGRWAPAAAGIVVALPLALQTRAYARHWTDDITLFRHAVEAVPRSTKAHHKLGEELLRSGELGDALRSLERALEIAPDNTFAAETLAQARTLAVARHAPGLRGEEGPGGGPLPDDPDILHALGRVAMEQGDGRTAATYWEEALRVAPEHARALTDLGALRVGTGDVSEGLRLFEAAVAAHPAFAAAWFNLGAVRLQVGDGEGARSAMTRFLDLAGSRYPAEAAQARAVLAAPRED